MEALTEQRRDSRNSVSWPVSVWIPEANRFFNGRSCNISKTGVIALTRALAKEYGRRGFRINVIIPGGIFTPGTRAVARDISQFRFSLLKTGYDFKARLPMNRGGQPDEVARVALFLASDLASYVRGALVPVDGGFLSA